MSIDDLRRALDQLAGPEVDDPHALDAVRRRVRRSRAWRSGGAAVLVVALLALGVLVFSWSPNRSSSVRTGNGGPSQSVTVAPTTASPQPTQPQPAANVHAISIQGFTPTEVIGDFDGGVWAMGNNGDAVSPTCTIVRASLAPAMEQYPTPCGMNGVAGDGALFFESDVLTPDNAHHVHILRFSTVTHTAVVLDPVVLTVFGSEIAHTQLAYGNGSLWLYGYASGAEIAQISPDTGTVQRVITGVPNIGGTEPIMTGAPGTLWLAGGAGGGSTIARIDTDTGDVIGGPTLVPGTTNSVLWMAVLDQHLLAGTFGPTSSVAVVAPDGSVLRNVPSPDVGRAAVVLNNAIYTLGPGAQCTTDVPVWRVDETTLQTTVVATINPTGAPCNGQSFRDLAAGRDRLFVRAGDGTPQGTALYEVDL